MIWPCQLDFVCPFSIIDKDEFYCTWKDPRYKPITIDGEDVVKMDVESKDFQCPLLTKGGILYDIIETYEDDLDESERIFGRPEEGEPGLMQTSLCDYPDE